MSSVGLLDSGLTYVAKGKSPLPTESLPPEYDPPDGQINVGVPSVDAATIAYMVPAVTAGGEANWTENHWVEPAIPVSWVELNVRLAKTVPVRIPLAVVSMLTERLFVEPPCNLRPMSTEVSSPVIPAVNV